MCKIYAVIAQGRGGLVVYKICSLVVVKMRIIYGKLVNFNLGVCFFRQFSQFAMLIAIMNLTVQIKSTMSRIEVQLLSLYLYTIKKVSSFPVPSFLYCMCSKMCTA